MSDDGWAEYARRTLERESSPLYDADLPKPGRLRKVLRDARGRVIHKPEPEDPGEPEPEIGVWSL